MTDMPPPDEPPLRGGRGRSPWPWVWGALGGAAVIALAVVLVIVLVPENNKRLSSGPIGSPSPTQAASRTPTPAPSSPSPSPSASPAPTSAPASPTTTPSPTGPPSVDLSLSPADPQAALKKQIAARWAAYEWALDDLYMSFSGDMSEFASTATGQLEIAYIDDAEKLHGKNEYQSGRDTYSDVTVGIVNSTTATVTACIDTDTTAYYEAVTTTLDPDSDELIVTASKLAQQLGGANIVTHTTMTLIDGRWMASAESVVANC